MDNEELLKLIVAELKNVTAELKQMNERMRLLLLREGEAKR